ncbi:MAG: Ni/Fe hydrogenase [Nitrosomonas sp.]|nr:Ni/Fe hydrogenase [Nitrosomonas sp.]MCW5606797.1 Ni/Fe hydrogenase [Nitrosomonas sp.]
MTRSAKKLFFLGYGNPGRGDDALGPLFIDKIAQLGWEDVCCCSDMQLLVEHVTDLHEYHETVFVDADTVCNAPFEFSPIAAFKDESYTSHALTPAALLYVYQQVYQRDPPAASLLRIRGYNFALGDLFSKKAAYNLNAAIQFINLRYWQS